MFETSSQPDPEVTYTLAGRLDRAGFAGSEYWVGWPQVYAIDDSGVSRAVDQAQIQSRITAGMRPWREVYGDQHLVIRDEGGIRYRAPVVVMPSDLRLQLRPGDRSGELDITSGELRSASADVQGERPHGRATPGGITLSFGPTVAPGEEVALHLLFRDGGEATLRVPAPVRAIGFVGRDGAPPARSVSVESLISVRARAVSPADQTGWVLECRLPPVTPWMSLQELPAISPSVFELSLHAVRDRIAGLFSLSDDLDARVEIRIVPRTGAIPAAAPSLSVQRYDAKLTLRRDGTRVDLALDPESAVNLGDLGRGLVRLEARPVTAPAEAAWDVPTTDTGWCLDTSTLAPGPWLLLGRIHNALRLRPLLLTMPGALPTATDELQKAVREPNPGARIGAIGEALQSLTRSWDTSEGARLRQFVGTLGDLPAVTFDAVKALASHPDAAALALLQTPEYQFAAVWAGLEELAFLWSCVPLASWVRAGRRLWQWTEAQREVLREVGFTPAGVIERTLEGFIQRGAERSPLVPLVHELLFSTIPHIPRPSGESTLQLARSLQGRAALRAFLEIEARQLCARHESEWWPTDIDSNRPGLSAKTWVAAQAIVPRLGTAHHQPTLAAPVVAALAAFHGEALPRQTLVDLRRLRAFDPVWFDLGHVLALALLVGERLENDRGYLDDV